MISQPQESLAQLIDNEDDGCPGHDKGLLNHTKGAVLNTLRRKGHQKSTIPNSEINVQEAPRAATQSAIRSPNVSWPASPSDVFSRYASS